MKIKAIAAAAALMACASPGFAAPITFNFEGIPSFGFVGDYYNGGAGPNLHTSFSDTALALVNDGTANTPSGQFFTEAPPAGGTVLFGFGGDIVLTAGAGFDFLSYVSFYYAAIAPITVSVFDVSNISLGSKTFGATNAGCVSTMFCDWEQGVLNFSGNARTIRFDGFDDANGGSSVAAFDLIQTEVPTPTTMWMLVPALAMLGVARSRRRRTA